MPSVLITYQVCVVRDGGVCMPQLEGAVSGKTPVKPAEVLALNAAAAAAPPAAPVPTCSSNGATKEQDLTLPQAERGAADAEQPQQQQCASSKGATMQAPRPLQHGSSVAPAPGMHADSRNCARPKDAAPARTLKPGTIASAAAAHASRLRRPSAAHAAGPGTLRAAAGRAGAAQGSAGAAMRKRGPASGAAPSVPGSSPAKIALPAGSSRASVLPRPPLSPKNSPALRLGFGRQASAAKTADALSFSPLAAGRLHAAATPPTAAAASVVRPCDPLMLLPSALVTADRSTQPHVWCCDSRRVGRGALQRRAPA
jgi:hypothetical protein